MTSTYYASEREYYAHEQGMELRFPECPNCGSTSGTPVTFSFGISSETGYNDAGQACSECMEVR